MTSGAAEGLSTHTHFFRGEEELEAAVAILAERAASGRAPRLWSAGCSTGAEPYTIAILCAERAIDAAIHATDLNADALVTARAARYPALALRGMPDHLIDRHFARRDDDHVVLPAITRRVTFEQSDLRTSPPPSLPAADREPGWDVILCRNVLIYYDPDTASAIVARLSTALRRDGVLIVGPTDPFAFRPVGSLQPSSLRGVASYTRFDAPARSDEDRTSDAGPRAEPSLLVAAPAPAEDAFERMLATACRALAAHAWDEAETALLGAERAAPVAPEPPLYLGVLRRKEGRFDEAFTYLRRAVFLSPDCWTASYLLAGAWERLGDPARARLELTRALKTLERFGADAPRPIGAEIAGVAFDPHEVVRACRQRLGQ